MPQRVTHAPLNNRDKILREATRLMALYGFGGTSMRMIAEACELQKGSLVYHFETKARLYEAVMDKVFNHWKDVLPDIMLSASNGENRFRRALDTCIDFFVDDPYRAKLLVRECMDNPREIRRRLSAQLAPWIGAITDAIDEGKKAGIILPSVDPMAYIWQVTFLILATSASDDLVTGIMEGATKNKHETQQRLREELTRVAHDSLFIHDAAMSISA